MPQYFVRIHYLRSIQSIYARVYIEDGGGVHTARIVIVAQGFFGHLKRPNQIYEDSRACIRLIATGLPCQRHVLSTEYSVSATPFRV